MHRVVRTLEIKNKLGLHARASALLVQTVNKFNSKVSLIKDGHMADGRSIMGILTLAATQGSSIQVEASGEDAERVVKAIEKLVDAKFNEEH